VCVCVCEREREREREMCVTLAVGVPSAGFFGGNVCVSVLACVSV